MRPLALVRRIEYDCGEPPFIGATPTADEIRCEAADPAAMTNRSTAESDGKASSECSTSRSPLAA